MIITCPSCDKKFNVDASLIPNEGRFLQCSFCKKKWYFKLDDKKPENEYIKKDIKIKKINPKENIPSEVDKIISEAEKIKTTNTISVSKNQQNFKFINFLFLSVITFTALILILDTFKLQINIALTGFNLLLDNFYESLKDIYLFEKSDSRQFTMSQNETETYGKEISFLEQIISNIGLPGLGQGPIIGSGKADK